MHAARALRGIAGARAHTSKQLGCNSWLLTEGSCAAGGLSATVTTPEGFMFDLGGHVLFSHFEVWPRRRRPLP